MEGKYFKARDRFDFKPNKYEIGTPVFIRKTHLDRHFLNKIMNLNIEEHSHLYDFHLSHYLKREPENEELFFKEIYALLQTYLNLEKNKNALKVYPKEKYQSDQRIKKYKAFIEMLESKDKWAVTSIETAKINELIEENKKLKEELEKYRIKPNHKIQIMTNEKEVLIDLFHQIQSLKHWEDKNKDLLITHSQNTWAKIFANYFSEMGEDIPFNTIKKHFGIDEIGKYLNKRQYIIKTTQNDDNS